MGYLVCERCEGNYKLKPGESPTDFLMKCECGGELNYSLTPALTNKKENNRDKLSLKDPRITRLMLGVLIVIIPNILFYYPTNYLFFVFSGVPLILAGFVSSFFIEGDVKEGVLNGSRVGLFSGIILLLLALLTFLITRINLLAFTNNSILDIGIITISILILILFTSAGGFIGIETRKYINARREKSEIKEKSGNSMDMKREEVPENILSIPDDEESEYHDMMVELGYKQMNAINDGEKVFNDLIAESISEEDAILQLKDDQKIVNAVLNEMQNINPPSKYKDYHDLKIGATRDICRTFEIIDGLVQTDEKKIHKTNSLVESSAIKFDQAISELNNTMLDNKTLEIYYNKN